MAVEKQITTLEAFLEFVYRDENSDRAFELINGEIVERMPGRASNSQIHDVLAFLARLFCREHGLPCYTASADGAFRVGDNIVEPDFAYRTTPFTGAYPEPEPPLWAVEIISPTDKKKRIRAKRQLYIEAGILYFEIEPDDREIDVYAPGNKFRIYKEGDVIDLNDIIPGFTLAVSELFE